MTRLNVQRETSQDETVRRNGRDAFYAFDRDDRWLDYPDTPDTVGGWDISFEQAALVLAHKVQHIEDPEVQAAAKRMIALATQAESAVDDLFSAVNATVSRPCP